MQDVQWYYYFSPLLDGTLSYIYTIGVLHRVQLRDGVLDTNHWLPTTLETANEISQSNDLWSLFEAGSSFFGCVPHGCIGMIFIIISSLFFFNTLLFSLLFLPLSPLPLFNFLNTVTPNGSIPWDCIDILESDNVK